VGNPALFPKLPWAQSELAPVGLIVAATNVIAVHPSVPANNLQEFIAYLRKNPGKVNYASQGNGSLSHVGTAVFAQVTQTQITHVPYKGSGPAIQDVLGGQVQMFITTPPSVLGHVQTGKLRALAVTSKTRHPMLPDVPTTAEAGLPGFELEAWVGLFAPAGTPPAVVRKINAAAAVIVRQEIAATVLAPNGMRPLGASPDALAASLRQGRAAYAELVKSSGVRLD